MSHSSNESFFVSSYEKRFGTWSAADDFLHPAMNAAIASDALTETQYFGFSVPEERIHALAYLWHHPRVGTLTGGAMVFQGIKVASIAAELFDMRVYHSDRVLEKDLHCVRLESSYQSEVLEPMRRHRIQYSDPERQNSFVVDFEALLPPVMWSSNAHFEQAMKARGELVLRGKHHKVDCYNVRDRTWAEARSEQILPIPPTTWMTGVFRDDFAFNCSAMDHPALGPIWKDHFKIDSEKVLKGGWLHLDGDTAHIVSAKKLTHYDPVTLYPEQIELAIEDDMGRSLRMTGTVIAACQFNGWLNLRAPVCLTKWECNGETAYGDAQDGQWNDFVSRYLPGR